EASRLGVDVRLLDASEVRAQVNSPAYAGGLWDARGCAMIDPARLAWGLRRACLAAGVRIYEHTPVNAIGGEPARGSGGRLALAASRGVVLAERVALAAGAFAPLLRRLRRYLIPVYDYALMTRPLTQAQLDSVGWQNRQGVGEL